MTKLVIISDTHTYHNQLVMPPGDILIHAGDFTNQGRPLNINSFLVWLDGLPYKHIIFISGNHDITLCPTKGQSPEFRRTIINQFKDLAPRIIYLENEGTIIDGVKFWGSPYTPEFMGWGFMKADKQLSSVWSLMPDDIDVLITHGPPSNLGLLSKNMQRIECGSKTLAARVSRVNPKLHIFGHIHEGYSLGKTKNKTKYINASSINYNFTRLNPPIVVEI